MSILRVVVGLIPRQAAHFGLAAALALGGCVQVAKVNPFAASGVDPRSAVAAQVQEASRTPGSYPHFGEIPLIPTDVRPVGAWREAVAQTWALRQTTQGSAAQIPFTLANGETWAEGQRAHIPSNQIAPPATDSQAQTDAYAAALRARATPPPPPN